MAASEKGSDSAIKEEIIAHGSNWISYQNIVLVAALLVGGYLGRVFILGREDDYEKEFYVSLPDEPSDYLDSCKPMKM